MSQIVAMGGGGFVEPEHRIMHRYLLSLVSSQRPRMCFVATGKGDNPQTIESFYRAFPRSNCEPTHLSLFDRDVKDLGQFVRTQDILLVWGGNTASMLAVWRAHGLDEILREAATEGVILAGACAGALAWFQDGVTDSFGGLDPLRDGLGLLPGSLCPHYNADPNRRPTYHRLVASGEMQAGTAIDVGVALRYQDGQLDDVVAQAEGLFAYRVFAADGELHEEKLTPRVL